MVAGGITIGQQYVWGGEIPFGLLPVDRTRHLYVVGQTGTGKSTLLKELVAQDINGGEGCAIIDPHGDLADELLELVPSRRIDDVVVFDPSDTQHVVAFNPFFRVEKDDRALVAGNLVSTFKHIWKDSWGPRLEHILYNACAAVLDSPDHLRPSFLALARLLVDSEFRDHVISHVSEPTVRRFFEDEFGRWNERQLAEYLASVQNKIGQLIANPFVRNIIGQWKPTIKLDEIMHNKRILVVRLSKGTLGEEPANLVGSLLVAGFLQTTMKRTRTSKRQPFHLYIDEFQNFTTSAFASILSEARKYGLSLTVAHQYIDQLTPAVRDAVFGNIGSMVSFRVGAGDAHLLSHEFGKYQPAVYRDLNRGRIVGRLICEGDAEPPFLGYVAPSAELHGNAQKVRTVARRTYTRPRPQVEYNIASWLRA